jgi:hypothetical protein
MDTSTAFDDLRAFRHSLHRCFDQRADALFELGDAMLTAGVVPSPVHLSLEPAHRRGWGSLYAPLNGDGSTPRPCARWWSATPSPAGDRRSTPWT